MYLCYFGIYCRIKNRRIYVIEIIETIKREFRNYECATDIEERSEISIWLKAYLNYATGVAYDIDKQKISMETIERHYSNINKKLVEEKRELIYLLGNRQNQLDLKLKEVAELNYSNKKLTEKQERKRQEYEILKKAYENVVSENLYHKNIESEIEMILQSRRWK